MFKGLLVLGVIFASLVEGLQDSHVQLLIKFPTRSRPEKFFSTLDLYYANLSGEVSYHFVIDCDQDDLTMNCPEVIGRLEKYPFLTYYFGNNKSKIEACNADMEAHLDFDVLLLVSDDMIPLVKGYDRMIIDQMQASFPDTDGIVHFNDGCQRDRIDTLPILGKKYYDRFKYIYYPEYKSFYCDDEMTAVSRKLNKYVYVNTVIIEHRHPVFHKADIDELYLRNAVFERQDADLYEQRRSMQFGLITSF